MLSITHIHYLLHDVFGIEAQSIKSCLIENEIITIQFHENEYREPCFDFENPELTELDFEMLDTVFFAITKHKTNNAGLKNLFKTITPAGISFLKLAHYFVNERYFGKPLRVDSHNRVTSDAVYRNIQKYLRYPMIDVLADVFSFTYLAKEKPDRTLYFTSDFDYINLWSYLGFLKTLWRFIKHIVFLRRMLFIEEFWSLLLSRKSLSRNFMLSKSMFLFKTKIGETLNIKNIAFLLVEKSHKKYDFKNNFKELSFKEYLNKVMRNVSFGIHPSYNTRYNRDTLKSQIETFEQVVFERPKASRFHFLNCCYPDDLLMLEANGIKQDFSFYFCDSILFRGSISRPFKQWSFTANRPVNVEIIPLSIMEVTLSKTLKLSFDEAYTIAKEKMIMSLLLGRTTVLLWHNNEMYEPLYRKNYSRKLLLKLKNDIEELESNR
jgi:hypothetical protein